MKKILISARDLNIGGIEKSLINLLEYFSEKKYNITLVLERKKGDLLYQVPKGIKIIEYSPSKVKIINLFKRIGFILKYGRRYNTSISFATYLKSGAFVARIASKNSCIWCHADYLSLYQNNKEKVEEFFDGIRYDKFSKIVFVSKIAKDNFLRVFPEQKNVYVCNNLINYREIYEKSREKIDLKYDEELITFLNVGRHDEKQKRISRIIDAAKKLKDEGYKFRIIFVGDGQDTDNYKEKVRKYNLQKNIVFVGRNTNPYPYYKIANCVLLSSDYEGYPVVFLESFILNKPIITTDVSDYKDIQDGRGIVVQKDSESLYNAMKKFIEEGYRIKESFNVVRYNEKIKDSINEIINYV